MSKEKTWILPIILFLAIVSINPVAITAKGFTCSECEALYWASVDYYSEYEIKKTLREYGCDECPNMEFLFGSSNKYDYPSDYSSSSDGSTNGFCILALVIFIILCIFILYRKGTTKDK